MDLQMLAKSVAYKGKVQETVLPEKKAEALLDHLTRAGCDCGISYIKPPLRYTGVRTKYRYIWAIVPNMVHTANGWIHTGEVK